MDFGASEAGRKGGKAVAESMTEEQRAARAKKAAMARWAKDGKGLPQATHEGLLKISNAELDCYVLNNGDRMLSTRGMMKGLGRVWRGRKYSGTEMPVFLEAKNLKPFIPQDLLMGPIVVEFLTPKGLIAEGIKAELVPQICDTYLNARDANALKPSQVSVAVQADILMRGFALVGIIALVDEATGFQDDRDRRALALILEKFIAKEFRQWVKTFPLDYYKQLCRLKSVPFSADMKMPQYFGHLTNDIVYKRLAPGVLKALREKNPVENGRRKQKHHQHLTENIGHPKLLQHLGSVVTLMKIASDWNQFHETLERIHPPHHEMPLFPDLESE